VCVKFRFLEVLEYEFKFIMTVPFKTFSLLVTCMQNWEKEFSDLKFLYIWLTAEQILQMFKTKVGCLYFPPTIQLSLQKDG